MTQVLVLQPLVAPWVLAALGGVALAVLGVAVWRGLKGWITVKPL